VQHLFLSSDLTKDVAKSKAAMSFFDWAFSNGDKAADDLDYVALPHQ
jgi:ABC-type phosphate transport system substrate-binding protein